MKRVAIILALGAAIACAIVMMPRSRDSRSDPGRPPEGPTAGNSDIRSRPQRGSASADTGEETSGTVSSAFSKDPQTALAEATDRLKDPELSLAIADILGNWAETSPVAALAWLEQSGPGRENADDLRAHVILTWSNKHPDAAATWLEENPGMQQPANLLALLGPWMTVSPEAAVAWSTTKIQPFQRESILADLLMSCRTEENALALLGEVDPVVADNALQAAVTSLADEEPELAGKLAALITGPVDSPGEKPQLDSMAPSPSSPSGE